MKKFLKLKARDFGTQIPTLNCKINNNYDS